jgi:hypothetical protein
MSNGKAGLIGALAGAVAAIVVIAIAAFSGVILAGKSADTKLHDYLMTHGRVLAEAMTKAQTDQDAATEAHLQASVSKLGMKAFLNPKVAFVTGPAKARRHWSSSSTTIARIAAILFPRCKRFTKSIATPASCLSNSPFSAQIPKALRALRSRRAISRRNTSRFISR